MIRKATPEDMDRILEIYSLAKKYMREQGNPHQWNGAYPDRDTLMEDIKRGELFLMEEENQVFSCFALLDGEDPTYKIIEGGEWISNAPYGTIHRIASDGTKRRVFATAVAFAKEKYNHLRVDTHKDNYPMQRAILREGFSYRGIIYLENGEPRNAYEWME